MTATTLPAVRPNISTADELPLLIVKVEDSTMDPTLKYGDFVLVGECRRFFCDALYVLDLYGYKEVWRCAANFQGGILIRKDNPLYGNGGSGWTLTIEEFTRALVGVVAAKCDVVFPQYFQGDHSQRRAA